MKMIYKQDDSIIPTIWKHTHMDYMKSVTKNRFEHSHSQVSYN